MKTKNSELDRIVETIAAATDSPRPTSWERSFLLSIHEQAQDGRALSEAQLNKLDQIETKLYAAG